MGEKSSKAKFTPRINKDQCKGCGRCIDACPKKVLGLSKELNKQGFLHVCYNGTGCIGCGICFYNCPEPQVIEIIETPEKSE